MPTHRNGSIHIYYEEHGAGFPILLLAPGGMRSAIALWSKAPWNPIAELAGRFRVIALDQRNAGRSSAPVRGDDGWHRYVSDQLALLDHLKIEHCHVIGDCIGGAFALGLIRLAPDRIASAVLQQPIGLDGDNRSAFHALFDDWSRQLAMTQPTVSDAEWQAFRARMYGSDFVFSVDRGWLRHCPVPLLVLLGNDLYHPEPVSREIVQLAPHAELIERWKELESLPLAVEQVRHFLERHTPSA